MLVLLILTVTIRPALAVLNSTPYQPSAHMAALNTEVSFQYTGAFQTLTIPDGATAMQVTLNGATGGRVFDPETLTTSEGGNGGLITTIFPVVPGDVYRVYVGGTTTTKTGGFNGGGNALFDSAAGGGGATDIRSSPYGLADRVAVAGGGGGGTVYCHPGVGGNGGYPSGVAGTTCTIYPGGGGGTATAGGTAGQYQSFCTAASVGTLGQGGHGCNGGNYGGGGGGGYYGGGGAYLAAGGGGSSYTRYTLLSFDFNSVGDGSASITIIVPAVTPPSPVPTVNPSAPPSALPTAGPTIDPTRAPTSSKPTWLPTASPSATPTWQYLPQVLASPTYRAHNGFSFGALTSAGAVLLWGGGKKMTVEVGVTDGALALVANRASFAALGADGVKQAWGVDGYLRGWESSGSVVALIAADGSYGALTTSGSVTAFGGDFGTPLSAFTSQLSAHVVAIAASSASFVALLSSGAVYTWGNKYCGGGVSSDTRADLSDIVKVVASMSAFAGLLASGGVVTWGDKEGGGDSSKMMSSLQTNVVHIIAAPAAFVAFKADTGIVVWGCADYGGDASAVASQLALDVQFVAHTASAFAALKVDGTVVTWGDALAGGDSSAVQAELVGVTTIVGNHYAFAALVEGGSVVSWGDDQEGGQVVSTTLVTKVFATRRAFAALKGATGELVVWGNPYHGGDAGAAAAYLTSGVRTVCGNDVAFTAILQDGRAVAWGHATSIPVPGLLITDAIDFSGVQGCA